MPNQLERYEGCLLALACGDAIGTSVEFLSRGSFSPVTGMVGGGPFSLKPGQWTDDTSMALLLAQSLLEKRGFDAKHQMAQYLSWWRWGYMSSTGDCFDIGTTTSTALARYEDTGEPFSGPTAADTAGNGSIMRLAPIVLYFHPALERVVDYAAQSSRTTHGAEEAIDCCRLLAIALSNALSGLPKDQLMDGAMPFLKTAKVQAIATSTLSDKPAAAIRGSGYAVHSLEASLWCLQTTNSLAEAVLAAANLGDDADTTAAITGQLAGAYYGASAIPADWLAQLYMGKEIRELARRLYQAATAVL